ncbi:unnamed protein product [Cyprideis torosa]|uniref:Protein kinase domain-containing protein n=1 Tax=Cyprideis torosa TaxID=163714 RepID=A0A7R8W702_9CRUS|nr:unnamed protein product [Cyprideis torosa]CAG0887069.1 unnamed protein product [Cyprideis torosa]
MSAQKSDFRLRPRTLEELRKIFQMTIKSGNMHDFEAGFPLGSGRFGRVFLALFLNFLLAMKVLFKGSAFEVQHGASIPSRDSSILDVGVIDPSEKSDNIWMLSSDFSLGSITPMTDKIFLLLDLEYAPGGDMYTHLSNRRFTERRTATYVWQISDALSYCHSKGVIATSNLLAHGNKPSLQTLDGRLRVPRNQ